MVYGTESTESTTSCQYMENNTTCYHRNKGEVEFIHVLLYLLCRVLEMRFCPMLMLAMPSFMS